MEKLRKLFVEVLDLVDVMLENNQKEEYLKEFDELIFEIKERGYLTNV